MTVNVGSTDRIIRLVAAVIAVIIAFVIGIGSVGGIILVILAIILAATAALRFCPIYRVFGMSTATPRSTTPRSPTSH